MVLDGVAAGEDGYESTGVIGIVFQMPEMQLFAMSAKEDVAFGPRQLGWAPRTCDEAVTGKPWSKSVCRLSGSVLVTLLALGRRATSPGAGRRARHAAAGCCCWTSRS